MFFVVYPLNYIQILNTNMNDLQVHPLTIISMSFSEYFVVACEVALCALRRPSAIKLYSYTLSNSQTERKIKEKNILKIKVSKYSSWHGTKEQRIKNLKLKI
jgi:hypothetical protein